MNEGQFIMFTCGMWGFILLWPKLGRHAGTILTRHSQGMKSLYTFLRMGINEYAAIMGGVDVTWSGHPDFEKTSDTLRRG
jgi:hypothetical protein